MLVNRTIPFCHIFYKKIAPHVSFQRSIWMAKAEAVLFYRFQLSLPQKFAASTTFRFRFCFLIPGFWEGGTHKQCRNICLSNINWLQKKKTNAQAKARKNWFLGGPFADVPGRGGSAPKTILKYLFLKYLIKKKKHLPKKFRETKLRLQLINFTQKLDIDVLWFRRRRPYKI